MPNAGPNFPVDGFSCRIPQLEVRATTHSRLTPYARYAIVYRQPFSVLIAVQNGLGHARRLIPGLNIHLRDQRLRIDQRCQLRVYLPGSNYLQPLFRRQSIQ